MRGATKVEHTELVTLLHFIPFFDSDVVGGHFWHADWDETHQADVRIVSVNVDNSSGCYLGQVPLWHVGWCGIVPDVVGLGVIRTIHEFCFVNGSRYRAVPSVITGGAQKGLVDVSTIKLLGQVTHVQDEIQGVPLLLYPEVVPLFHAMRYLERRRLTGIRNNGIIIWKCYRADFWAKLSGEKIIPRFKTIMLSLRVAFELFSKVRHCFHCVVAKPTMSRMLTQNIARVGTWQELSPVIENILEQPVDFVVQEGGKSSSRSHWPVQDDIDGEADQTSFVKLGSCCHDAVDEYDHHLPRTNFCPFWSVWEVILLPEHLMEEHVDLGIGEYRIQQSFNRFK